MMHPGPELANCRAFLVTGVLFSDLFAGQDFMHSQARDLGARKPLGEGSSLELGLGFGKRIRVRRSLLTSSSSGKYSQVRG